MVECMVCMYENLNFILSTPFRQGTAITKKQTIREYFYYIISSYFSVSKSKYYHRHVGELWIKIIHYLIRKNSLQGSALWNWLVWSLECNQWACSCWWQKFKLFISVSLLEIEWTGIWHIAFIFPMYIPCKYIFFQIFI